ncbi:plasmid stabilization protein [Oscillatoriales cyanobacterium USR001]|nr:plasmid stabilization protein [Oscillatoriales cyanobacterium USR001]
MAIAIKRPLAELDLLDIWEFIADDSPERADEFLDKIEGKLQTLARNPDLGKKRNELLEGLQSFPIGNYLVFYREIGNGIDVIRVLRGSRDLEEIFRQN